MTNDMASIDNLINQEGTSSTAANHVEDEDRKFLRAAAEAIVATSMNSQIDPTILELLKRIQYASHDTSSARSPQIHQLPSQHHSQHQSPPQHQHQHQDQHQHQNDGLDDNHASINNYSTHEDLFNHSNLINPIRTTNQNHFPTFNLSYFDNIAAGSNRAASSTNTNSTIGSNNNNNINNNTNGSSWSSLNNNVILSNQRNNSITTPNSLTSGSPGNHTPPSTTASSASNTYNVPTLQRSESTSHINLSNNSSEKPFICKDCSLSFRRSSDLRRHQRAHLPILPHICQLCGKGFARKDALKRHSDTLTCKRNREKLLSSGGDLDSILLTQTGFDK